MPFPPLLADEEILAARGPKQPLDVTRPYQFFVEPEFSARGRLEDVATLFLTNRECPFRCLMCDLWRNTTDERVPLGAIPQQIDYALQRLPAASQIKLYNSGNFFDRQAIPREDWPAIAERLKPFQTVILENHPALCGPDCRTFQAMLPGELEIAMGLETIHPDVLPRLNKHMTAASFARAAAELRESGIHVRAFILLRPPYLSEEEGREWALRSLDFAFGLGVRCCSLIPTRSGNGIMERLAEAGQFQPPSLTTLESVLESGLREGRGRVFADEWDLERLPQCPRCGPARRGRLQVMNRTQQIPARVSCPACPR